MSNINHDFGLYEYSLTKLPRLLKNDWFRLAYLHYYYSAVQGLVKVCSSLAWWILLPIFQLDFVEFLGKKLIVMHVFEFEKYFRQLCLIKEELMSLCLSEQII